MEHDDPEDLPDPVAETSLEEIVEAERQDEEAEREVVQKSEDEAGPSEDNAADSKNIKLEITNPDDIDMDDKGQLGLF